MPFEILPIEADRRLIDAYQISYLSVGRDALRFRHTLRDGLESGAQPGPSLVVADPDYDLSLAEEISASPISASTRQSKDLRQAGFPFKPLAGTATEGQAIAEMLQVAPLLKEAALESDLKAYRSPKIVHIATHGFFLDDQPDNVTEMEAQPDKDLDRLQALARLENPLLRSGLALAGANRWNEGEPLPPAAEDGILTAEDVSGLDFSATELVVLSACETGLGQIQVGEGVFGLRRAVMLAGAKTLVMSLWKVPDLQTQALMTNFYRRILAGEPRAAALRAAQLTVREKYPDPFFWGAFICQGEPGPLV